MPPDLWLLYSLMLKSRLFEEATAQLWREGLISGELHLGRVMKPSSPVWLLN